MHKTCTSSRSRTRRCVHARTRAKARTYDANGNRLTSIHTIGSGGAAQTTRRTYTVDATSNRILSFTQTQLAGTATTGGATSNVNYSFDANGAMLKDGLRSYEFDAANRLGNVTTGVGIDAPTTRYVHNALGQRVFKTEPLYAPVSSGSNPADPGVMQTLANFFASLWGGNTTTAAPSASEKLGFAYYYDEDGSLLFEQGSGGANSTGSTHYVYLPTPAGPMPIATYTGNKHYAVHTDHLNTPRRLTNSGKQVAWQWAFSTFGDEQPTLAKNRFVDPATTPNAGTMTVADVTFNLRYPGQYFDKESNLHYNYFRSYDARTGRYTQSDPIDLAGGWNRFGYVEGNPLMYSDPDGLRVRPGPRTNGGNSRQRREADRTETSRVESYLQRRAEQDAWISGFTRTNENWNNNADGVGSLTGAGGRFNHPSVPNSLEWLISPDRINRGEPYVPSPPVPICERSSIR